MKKLIINADDFGLSKGVCDAILFLLKNERISSTSLMLCADDALDLIQKYELQQFYGSIGIHLQLTSGHCLSNPKLVSSLLVKDTKRFLDNRKKSTFDIDEVEIEWRNQIRIGMDLIGGLPSHFDTHHDVHKIPELEQLYLKLAKEYGVRFRSSKDIVQDWTGKNLTKKDLFSLVKKSCVTASSEATIELIVHPGFSDDYLRSITSLSDARMNDYNVLSRISERDWLSYCDVEFIKPQIKA